MTVNLLSSLLHVGYLIAKNAKEAILDYSTKEAPHDIGDEYYSTGYGYLQQKNYPLALKYLRLAADRGNASAQASLGHRYAFGQGVAPDNEQAAKWYQLAADQGHPKAQVMLAFLYGNGTGVVKDRNKALELIKSAAMNGFEAQSGYKIGTMFAEGVEDGIDRVEVDHVQAYAWFSVAAMERYPGAESMRATVAGKMTSAERDIVDDLLFPRRASGGGGAADGTASRPGASSKMNRFCSNCGDQFRADDHYCKSCGNQRGTGL